MRALTRLLTTDSAPEVAIRSPSPSPPAVVHQRLGIQSQIHPQLAGELDEPFNVGFTVWGIKPDSVGSHRRDVPQLTASLAAVTVPDQVAQSRDVVVDVSQRALLLQVQAEKARQAPLDMPHSHRDMEPVHDMCHPIARG